MAGHRMEDHKSTMLTMYGKKKTMAAVDANITYILILKKSLVWCPAQNKRMFLHPWRKERGATLFPPWMS
jgi:hypothetical protein